MKPQILPILCSVALLAGAASCKTVPDPATFPDDITVASLSQKGQEALDDSNYKAAEVYYQTIINRYGTDTAALTAAEFEIAHIRMKQKHWDDARIRLDAIIARYEEAGGAGLPPEYLVLAKNDRARIPGTKPQAPVPAK